MKKLESGRTMVEMIAVLMIMIILSLVGMIGYNGVKNYWKATEIISNAQDVMAYARTKGTYVQATKANFSLPKGIIDMEAYVGGDQLTLSSTTNN